MLRTRTGYTDIIKKQLVSSGYLGKYNPLHIEAWMRIEHGCLDGLSKRQFDKEVEIARQCCDAVSFEESENLANSIL